MERGMGVREVARKAGISAGGLTQIEQGQRTHPPQLAVLDRLARALELSLTDLLSNLGYDVPHRLPDCIRRCYGQLPDEVVGAATAYVERLAAGYVGRSHRAVERETKRKE